MKKKNAKTFNDNSEDCSEFQNNFDENKCVVLKGFTNIEEPGNSRVYALANPIPINFIESRISDFKKLMGKERNLNLSDFKLGLNVVKIKGNEIDKEGLHVHLSHIFAIVFDGKGILHWEDKNGTKYMEEAHEGDCVIVPRGVMHYFTGKMSFAALEVSDIIDYQKHHYSSIE